MDVLFDCELNLSANFDQIPKQKPMLVMNGKKQLKNEQDALIDNGTWKPVDPPIGNIPISCKWVYKNKYKSYASLEKHKVRPVVKGYAQK